MRKAPVLAIAGIVSVACAALACWGAVLTAIFAYPLAAPRLLSSPLGPPLSYSGKPPYAPLCQPALATDLTKAERDAYFQTLKGTRITGWKRYVWEVNAGVRYAVMLTLGEDLSSWDTQVNTSDPQVLKLSKGQLWEFSGTITGGNVVERGKCIFYIDGD